jgi:hypothetical protein
MADDIHEYETLLQEKCVHTDGSHAEFNYILTKQMPYFINIRCAGACCCYQGVAKGESWQAGGPAALYTWDSC